MTCDECEHARCERDPYATGGQWHAEYYCTQPKCVEKDQQIAYWPDGSWAELSAVEEGEYGWKSDDYTVVSLPGDMDSDAVGAYVQQHI